jgi:hypothetical protein
LIGRPFSSKIILVKRLLLIFALALIPSLVPAEDWKTSDGNVYKNVTVVRVEDDAVTIIYKDGGALIPLFKLPPDLQERFNYDPAKAKAAAVARAKADAENAKQLQAEIELSDKLKRDQQIKDAAAQGQTNSAQAH